MPAGLLEEIAHMFLSLEIAHTLGAYNTLGPLTCNKIVKADQVQWTATIEDPCAYAIFVAMWMFCIVVVPAAMTVFMVMVVTLASFFVVVALFFMMMVMSAMWTCFLVVVMVLVVIVMVFCFFMLRVVQFLYPFCRGGNAFKVEKASMEQCV